MLILGQDRSIVVNVDNIHSLSVYNDVYGKEGKKYRVLAWYGAGENDCWGIGDYETENRAKEILREIWQKYGEYMHRSGGPAILKGSVDIPEDFWVLPKVYEMPEV